MLTLIPLSGIQSFILSQEKNEMGFLPKTKEE